MKKRNKFICKTCGYVGGGPCRMNDHYSTNPSHAPKGTVVYERMQYADNGHQHSTDKSRLEGYVRDRISELADQQGSWKRILTLLEGIN